MWSWHFDFFIISFCLIISPTYLSLILPLKHPPALDKCRLHNRNVAAVSRLCLWTQAWQDCNTKMVTTWILGFFFVTIISLSSLIGLLFIPSVSSKSSKSSSTSVSFSTSFIHNGFEGLALGSLLASSIFHLIPHAFDLVGQGQYNQSVITDYSR